MFIELYVKTLSNPALVESLTAGYQAIMEAYRPPFGNPNHVNGNGTFVNGEPPFTADEIKMMVKIMQANAKMNMDSRTPQQMEADIKRSPGQYKAVAKRARMAMQNSGSGNMIKSHATVQYTNNVQSAANVPKHEVRKAYYEAALKYIGKTYSENGIPFELSTVLTDVLDSDKKANDEGKFEDLRIANMPFPFLSVVAVNKNPIISELRSRNYLFNGIVARWYHLMRDLHNFDMEHDAVGKKMRIEQFLEEERSFKGNRDKLHRRKDWRHLDTIMNDVADINAPKYLDDGETLDLTDLDDVNDKAKKTYDELDGEEPRFGESLGEFIARRTEYTGQKINYDDAMKIYQQAMGSDDLHDYPNKGESYRDYLQGSKRHDKESWSDFAYRLYYDSIAAYGNGCAGSVSRELPAVAKMIMSLSKHFDFYKIPEITRIVMLDWVIVNKEFFAGRDFDVHLTEET